MNNFLPVNKMTCLLNFIQQGFDIWIPISKFAICSLILLFECYLPGQSVDLGIDALVDNHVSNFGFCAIFRNTNKSCQSWDFDFAIVLFNDSEIMLNQLSNEFSHVRLWILSAVAEGLVSAHTGFNFSFIQRHELKCEEFVNESGQLVVFLKLASILFFNDVQHIDFFVVIRADKQENDKVLERWLVKLAISIKLGFQIAFSLVDGVEDGLVGFAGIEDHFFVDEVLDHVLPIPNFQFFKAFFIQMSFWYFSA